MPVITSTKIVVVWRVEQKFVERGQMPESYLQAVIPVMLALIMVTAVQPKNLNNFKIPTDCVK